MNLNMGGNTCQQGGRGVKLAEVTRHIMGLRNGRRGEEMGNSTDPKKGGSAEAAALGLLALVFASLAAVFFIRPQLLFAPISLSEGPPALWAELRAAYGSFFGTSALLFGAAARRAEWRGAALMAATLILGGFVTGRCLSLVLDGLPSNPVAWINLAAEFLGMCVTAALWRRHRRSSRSAQ